MVCPAGLPQALDRAGKGQAGISDFVIDIIVKSPKVIMASEAKQSDEVVVRAKPAAISGVPSLRSRQGFVAALPTMTCD
jgi:hypothetical protein